MARDAWLIRPRGLIDHDVANAAMHELADRRLAGEIPDTLMLLEHPPVYTAGRRSRPEDLLWTDESVLARGAQVRWIDRGGAFTFHGPGQLVGYPIVDLGPRPDALAFVRRLEEIVIQAAGELGVALDRSPCQTGVWSGQRKVCAIGVRIKRMRVTLHGFAVNCTTDLSWFDAIVPCGVRGAGVGSLSALAGRTVGVDELAPVVARRFERAFGVRLAAAPPAVAALGRDGPAPTSVGGQAPQPSATSVN
jgi:lipoyl(octanoyl) transferase